MLLQEMWFNFSSELYQDNLTNFTIYNFTNEKTDLEELKETMKYMSFSERQKELTYLWEKREQ